jgi:urease accessory protein
MRTGWLACAGAAGLALLAPAPAEAHTYLPQAGAFTNGLIHPFLLPESATALVALGVWLGQQDQAKISAGFAGFLVAALAGFVLAGIFPPLGTGPLILGIGALIAGGLCALAWALPKFVSIALSLVIGTGFGIASQDPFLPLSMAIVAGLGSAAGSVFLLLNLIALGTYLRGEWIRIGYRIIGSWTAAIALLILTMRLLQ